MTGEVSKLMKDMNNVPSIVGGLGLAVAEAQKAFNLDYLNNIERLLGLIKSLGTPTAAEGNLTEEDKEKLSSYKTFVEHMLTQLAPSRYQFTETTLNVKLDLAQSMDIGGEAAFGVQLGAVSVNAGISMAYGQDYRAAAEVKSVLNAIPADQTFMSDLLGRADDLSEKSLTLPDGATVDQKLIDNAHAVVSKATGIELKTPAPAPEEPEA